MQIINKEKSILNNNEELLGIELAKLKDEKIKKERRKNELEAAIKSWNSIEEKQGEIDKLNKERNELNNQMNEKQDELPELRKKKEDAIMDTGAEGDGIAIGKNSFASGSSSIAFGGDSESIGDYTITIGNSTKTTKADSIAIGHGVEVTGEQSIAIGKGHRISGNRSVAIGDPNIITGDDSVALGNNNTISSNHVMVLGNNIAVGENLHHSVVLGSNSTVSSPVSTTIHTIGNTEYHFAGSAPIATVSVGAVGKERTLTNLAAGRISDTSTDGINGSQLNAVIEKVNNLSTDLAALQKLPKGNEASPVPAPKPIETHPSQPQYNNLTFEGKSGVEIERNGNKIIIKGKFEDNPLTLKTDKGEGKLTNTIEIIGSDNIETEIQNGKALIKTKPIIKIKKLETDEITIGSTTINSKNLDVGNKAMDNVKDGEISKDSKQAVNGSQLYNFAKNMQNIINNPNTQQIETIGNQLGILNNKVSNIENHLEQQNILGKARQASALAAAGLMQAYAPGQYGTTVAIGHFQGQSAIAVGFSALSDQGTFGVKGAITTNMKNEFGGNVGVGYFRQY